MIKVRNNIFKILILLVIMMPILFSINVGAAEGEYQRGDLRCPTTALPANVTCHETKNSDGVVTQVDLVYGGLEKDGDIQITKTVKKNLKELGHYDVQFNVKGKNVSQKKTADDVYIAVILDYSSTIAGNISNVQEAAKTFARTLIPDNENGSSNYYIKLIQFASLVSVRTKNAQTNNYVNKNFQNVSFASYDSLGSGGHHRSFIDKAFNNVSFPKGEEKKYIFIFGDGRYWSDNDTDPGAAISSANSFKKKGVKIYGIRYGGTSLGETLSASAWAANAGCARESTYNTCDASMMRRLVTKYYEASGNLKKQFEDIAKEIVSDVEEDSSSFVTDLTDNIGDDFYLSNDTGDYQRFRVGKFTETGWTSPSFEIEIAQYVKGNEVDGGGWHETNKNFNLSYTDENGDEHVIGVDVNPEVYWIPYDLNLHTCHGSSTAGTVRDDESDEYQYFTKSCKEGYMENGVNRDGFKTEAIVNNLTTGTRSFNLLAGLGFPTQLKFTTNVVCTYQFDADSFNKRYNQLQKGLKSEDPKEVASATKQLINLDNILKKYTSLNNKEDLNDYAIRFADQSATLKITYKDSKLTPDNFNFENVAGTVKTDNIKCTTNKSAIVNGDNIPISQTCKATFSKEMQIAGSCLNMQTGNQESCSSNLNNQIEAGAKAYTKLKSTGGYISIKIPKTGYKQNLDIELKDKASDNKYECEFSGEDKLSNIIYRQIELTDPFLKTYDPKRGIGRNYLGDQFNFEKIIHDDIWDEDQISEYHYLISKENINNIKKDTAEDPKSSYLGRNCYFTEDNKYQCSFTRNKAENGSDNATYWFYDYKIS